MNFWNVKQNDAGQSELYIDGEIKMEQGFDEWLLNKPDRSATAFEQAVRAAPGALTVWINSPGGDVFAASLIYTALKNHHSKVTIKVSSIAASAASVIAMAGNETLMSPTALMMIHNPLTEVSGEVDDMKKAIEALTNVKESIINAYATKTKLSRQKISEMMNAETWITSKDAVTLGFADGIMFDTESKEITNDYLNGARMVYNSISQKDIPEDIQKLLLQNRENNKTKFMMAKINLERKRF